MDALSKFKLLRWGIGVLLVLVFLYVLHFHGLGERELWSSHEARAAQDAQSILDGADWRLPRLQDGRPELQKPPLYYWLTALAARCRGQVDEVAVRLPATLGALLTALALFVFLWQRGQMGTGIVAALVLLTMVHFTWMSRVGRIDMPLTAATTWAIVSFLIGSGDQTRQSRFWAFGWYLLGYLALALGLMLKGPIALVLVGAALLPMWVFSPSDQRPSVKSLLLSLLWGLPLLALMVVPWCWWVNQATSGEFVREFLIRHNFQRGLGGDDQLDAHINGWWFYVIRIGIDWLPWSLLLPVAAWTFWKKRHELAEARWGACWALGILACLSVLQYKRADYLLPAYPGAALFLAVSMMEMARSWRESIQRRVSACFILSLLIIGLGWFGFVQWGLPRWEPQRGLKAFAEVVRQHHPRPGQIILFRIDSHHLNWELGKSTERIWEWENLSWWAIRPAPVYVIMPEWFAQECDFLLQEGHLTPIASTTGLVPDHEEPLVLLVNDVGRMQRGGWAGPWGGMHDEGGR